MLKLVLSFVALLALAACSSGPGPSDYIKLTTPVPVPNVLKHSIALDKVSYAHSFLIEPPIISDFKEALTKTLAFEALSAPIDQDPKYKISVEIDANSDVPIFDSHMSFSFNAKYAIYDTQSGEIIFNKEVTTECDGEKVSMWKKVLLGPIESGANQNVLQMIYCAEHQNIEDFIQSLSTIK